MVKYQINQLIKEGLIKKDGSNHLTAAGQVQAENLVRAHRLWESYQVNSMGLDKSHIHDDAERQEHHLSEDILDELDARLGYPTNDPHGSPIPKRVEGVRLSAGILKKIYFISKNQRSDKVESFLWELGIPANEKISIVKQDKNEIIIKAAGKNIKIPTLIAKNIQIEEEVL
jgi:Mn-dependent DtxR family transcriptional regulator